MVDDGRNGERGLSASVRSLVATPPPGRYSWRPYAAPGSRVSPNQPAFRSAGNADITSTVAARDRIRGDCHVGGGLRIDGVMHGDIKPGGPDSAVIVGPDGYVEGNLRAARMRIDGQVKGAIAVDGHLDIGAGAVVAADIRYATLSIAAGAAVSGVLTSAAD